MDSFLTSLNIRRAIPLFRLLGCLALAIALLNTLGYACFRPHPRALWMQEWLNPTEKKRVSTQLASAEHWVERASRSTPAPSIGLILGLSTAREGIDPQLLERELGSGVRAVNLGSSGGSFQELAYYSEGLDRTPLRPEWIVIGVHTTWLAGRRPDALEPMSASDWLWRVTHRRGPERIRTGARQRAWLEYNYLRIHNGIQNALRGHALAPAPWVEPGADLQDTFQTLHLYSGMHADPEFIRLQTTAFGDSGWYDAERYSSTPEEFEALRVILLRCLRISPRVSVVLMPEADPLRRRIPHVAADEMTGVMQSHPQVEVLDGRALIAEEDFYDLVSDQEPCRAIPRWRSWMAAP